jgi:hypothetical protein
MAVKIIFLIKRFPELQNILEAIFTSKKRIGLMIVMIVIITYFTAIIVKYSFLNLQIYYNFSSSIGVICNSLWKCGLFIFDVLNKNDGGFGYFLPIDPYDEY